MKATSEPSSPVAPAAGLLPLINAVLAILGGLGGVMLIVQATGPAKDYQMAMGIASLLYTLAFCWTVNLVIETRRELYAARLDAQAAAAVHAWLMQQTTEAKDRAQRQGECLDWIVQRMADGGAEDAGFSEAPQPRRIALPVS